MNEHGVVMCECGRIVRRLCNCHPAGVAETVKQCRACENRLIPPHELAKLAQEVADSLKPPGKR